MLVKILKGLSRKKAHPPVQLGFDAYAAPRSLQKLTVEITTYCNLKCAGCPRTTAIQAGSWADLHMDMDRFRQILDHIPPVGFVTLHGIGEPTLHPQFIELVTAAKKAGKFGRMKMTTNALSRSLDYYEESVKAGLDEFWISVDSLDQAIASQMRFGTKVEKLERQVGALIERGLPVHISLVVSSVNYEDVPSLLLRLHDLGRPPVHMQEYQDFGNPFGMMTGEQRSHFMALLTETLPKVSNMFVVPPNFSRPQGDICTAPWLRPAITVEGYLTPCCTTFDPSQFGYVNVAESSFEDVWRSKPLLGWIERFLENEPDICQGCPLNPRSFGMSVPLQRSGKTGRERHVDA